LVLVALFALSFAQIITFEDDYDVDDLWFKFKLKFNKSYADEKEEGKRLGTFKVNINLIKHLNTMQRVYGVTKFMDLTPTEFRQRYLMPKFKGPTRKDWPVIELEEEIQDIPTTFDWSSKGAVTKVKDQGQCGSCWAFSCTEAIESQWFLAGHSLAILSPQQIVDCDKVDQGCDGGDTPTCYEYVMSTKGLEAEKDYKYKGEDDSCKFSASKVVAKISNWTYVTNNNTGEDETKMLQVLYSTGPLSVCIDAETWQFYFGGVVSHFCGTDLDHCAVITGFDTKENWEFEDVPIWNVRNSWGADWGESGYIWIQRGDNLCGIAEEVTLPVVLKSQNSKKKMKVEKKIVAFK